MKLVNQATYFERRGDGFVFRPTIFSAGYVVSTGDKDRLVEAFERLTKRNLVETLCAVALVGVAFWTEVVTSPTPFPWFALLSVLAAALLAVVALHRRDRAIKRILGGRAPDVARLPLREALTRPRPSPMGRRYALPILRSMIWLFALTTVVVDLMALVPVVAIALPARMTQAMTGDQVITDALAHTLYSVEYWVVVAAINVMMGVCLRLLVVEIRRLRALPDTDAPLAGPPSPRGEAPR